MQNLLTDVRILRATYQIHWPPSCLLRRPDCDRVIFVTDNEFTGDLSSLVLVI